MADDITAARRTRDSALRTAANMRSDEAARLAWLERAVEAQREVAQLEAARIDALEPCRMCGRKVTTPCDNAEGYYESGPWDASCEEYVRG